MGTTMTELHLDAINVRRWQSRTCSRSSCRVLISTKLTVLAQALLHAGCLGSTNHTLALPTRDMAIYDRGRISISPQTLILEGSIAGCGGGLDNSNGRFKLRV